MKIQEKIEKRGYKVTYFMSGNGVQAEKNGRKIAGRNITDLWNKIK